MHVSAHNFTQIIVHECACVCVDTSTWWPWETSLMASVDSTGLVGLISLQIRPFAACFSIRETTTYGVYAQV